MAIIAASASAQTPATRNPAANVIFDVTSVVTSSPQTLGSGIPQWSGARVTVLSTTLRGLILRAYPGYGVERLTGEPPWAASRVVESEPSLARLLMVSSVESAANQWRRDKGSPAERLEAEKPELVSYLQSFHVDDLIIRVAKEFADSLGATKKFIDFLLTHLPSPPIVRPSWAKLSWEEPDLKKALRLVYAYRSKALHEGVPFPAPMCEPPIIIPDSDVLSEVPHGLASSTLGGVWRVEDTPMLLHVFEYISRNTILAWFRSLRFIPEQLFLL